MEVGEWKCFVHIPIQEIEGLDQIDFNGYEPLDHYHISLSRLVGLRIFQIPPFLDRLKLVCSQTSPFDVSFDRLSRFINDDNSKAFIAANVCIGADKLASLVKQIDSIFLDFHLPPYYENPKFHASLAWGPSSVPEMSPHYKLNATSRVTVIACKVANKYYEFPLA
jgi:hypothetical protein